MDHTGENAGDTGHLVEGQQGAGQVQHQEYNAHTRHHPRQQDVLHLFIYIYPTETYITHFLEEAPFPKGPV